MHSFIIYDLDNDSDDHFTIIVMPWTMRMMTLTMMVMTFW